MLKTTESSNQPAPNKNNNSMPASSGNDGNKSASRKNNGNKPASEKNKNNSKIEFDSGYSKSIQYAKKSEKFKTYFLGKKP